MYRSSRPIGFHRLTRCFDFQLTPKVAYCRRSLRFGFPMCKQQFGVRVNIKIISLRCVTRCPHSYIRVDAWNVRRILALVTARFPVPVLSSRCINTYIHHFYCLCRANGTRRMNYVYGNDNETIATTTTPCSNKKRNMPTSVRLDVRTERVDLICHVYDGDTL